MRLNFVSLVVAAAALVLTACNADVDIEPGADSTAAMMDTTTVPPPAVTDTSALVDTTTTTTTTTTTETTSGTTDATTGGTTTPSTSTSTTTTTKPTTSAPTSGGTTTPPASTPPPSTPPPSTPPPSTPPPTTPTPPTGGADAKATFLAQKCNTCHNVPSASISKTMASSKAPDLKGGRSAATIVGYLKGTESINGKKHVKKWTGSEADLQAVAAWLAGL